MTRFLYTCLYLLLTPYLFLRLWLKSFKSPNYKHRITERFGIYAKNNQQVDIWLHLVSLGEVITAIPLIKKLLIDNKKLLITTTTPTGSAKLIQCFADKIIHCYTPYELPIVLKRFFKNFRPKIGIILETELWPNLIYYAKQANIKLLLFNACLSEKSFINYLKIKFFISKLLNYFDGIYTQSSLDTQRFKLLGTDINKLHTVGNLKFALQVPTFNSKDLANIKNSWGSNRIILLFASTHNNEEQQILTILRQLQNKISGLLLIIAPRHPERFTTIFNLAKSLNFATSLISQSQNKFVEVIVIDKLGELLKFYALSDYAIVGGSFVPIGGHNILEPIAMRVPVLIGPYIDNIKEICIPFFATNTILQVQNINELIIVLLNLYNSNQNELLTTHAYEIFMKNQNVLEDYCNILNTDLVYAPAPN